MKNIAKVALKNCTQTVYGDELDNLTEHELDIWIDCMWSNIRADILMLVIQQEENYLDNIDWFWFARGSGKTIMQYELFRQFIKRKYDIGMPTWNEAVKSYK